MDYSPLNITVWGLFLAFVIIVLAVDFLYARGHPDYPGEIPDTFD